MSLTFQNACQKLIERCHFVQGKMFFYVFSGYILRNVKKQKGFIPLFISSFIIVLVLYFPILYQVTIQITKNSIRQSLTFSESVVFLA
jgi:hypothetical protein